MSDTTIVQPQVGQSILTTSDGKRFDREHRDEYIDKIIQRDVEKGFSAAALAASTTDVRGDHHASHTDQRLGDTSAHTNERLGDLAAQSIVDAAKNTSQLSVQNDKNASDIQVQAQTFQNLSAVSLQNIGNLLNVQAVGNFNSLTTQANLVQYSILLDSQKNAAAGVLLATQIAATAAAQAAECCCELKVAIHAEGERTRDLLNSQTEQNLRDRNADLQTKLAAYYAAKAVPVVP